MPESSADKDHQRPIQRLLLYSDEDKTETVLLDDWDQ